MQHFNTEHYTGAQNLHGNPLPRGIGTSLTETPLSKIWCNDSVQLDGPKGAFNNPDIFIKDRVAMILEEDWPRSVTFSKWGCSRRMR